MINKFLVDEWKIIEEGFVPEENRFSESIFSLGNEHMGLRGFFEEGYSGDSLQGTYVAGVYYPDKTRVGWWKIGYPEFFAKVLNSTNWIMVEIEIDGVKLDLAKAEISNFKRELDMQAGKLTRSFIWHQENGRETKLVFTRFLSMAENNLAIISIQITPLNYQGNLKLTPALDGRVVNEDANYGEVFWDEISHEVNPEYALLTMKTKKTGFYLTTAFGTKLFLAGQEMLPAQELRATEKFIGYELKVELTQGKMVELQKFVAVCTSRDHDVDELAMITLEKLKHAKDQGYQELYQKHLQVLSEKWSESDVIIKGDSQAQQGIRYCIFQLNQTYTGKDPRLNIGPKGFTGEKYGGSTYWDTEAFCFPFYLATNAAVAKNLLYYRYLHLKAAQENAAKLGCQGALYPMVTMDGQECHNEWEITFEEIHRNGAIAYAIYNYTNYTQDYSYLFEYGLEVLVELSRYWASRVNYHPEKDRYFILGVTGPNEYENNVNNNWYTNTMAAWTLEYTLNALEKFKQADAKSLAALLQKTNLKAEEFLKWQEIIAKMYYPYAKELGIFEQNDGYLDKEQQLVAELPASELPLNKHWSWDRILRSCFIKQADVIQGIYFFPERYEKELQQLNFDFYEPRTVHESSLSASIYSIAASRIGYQTKAYELYLRTARLDLDNYNDDTDEGIHLTSMAGSWAAIVQGFAGVMVEQGKLKMNPYLPKEWEGYSFKFTFQERHLEINVNREEFSIKQLKGESVEFEYQAAKYQMIAGQEVKLKLQN